MGRSSTQTKNTSQTMMNNSSKISKIKIILNPRTMIKMEKIVRIVPLNARAHTAKSTRRLKAHFIRNKTK